MNLEWITLIGLAAAVCTTFSFVPQFLKALKSKQTKDLSMLMYSVLTIGLFLWLVYGIILKDLPLILANGISFGFSASVLALKIKHG